MILTLLAALAASLDAEPRDWELPPALKHGIPQPLPSGDPSIHGMYDLEDLVILRPQGTELQDGFSYGAFSRAVEAAIQDREPYDFVCIVHSDQLPTQFSGAAAFHLSYNNLELFGTGKYAVSNPQYDLKAGLWMTYPSYWDDWGGPEIAGWVFGQELAHYWLAFPEFDQGNGREGGLLGRSDAHWSWFMDTPNSPMEGNRWIDNGDGTFTTDISEPGRFAPIDLYMMGLIEAEDVPPMFYIEPSEPLDRTASSAPEFLHVGQDITIEGTRVEVTIEDVIAAEGDRLPSVADSPVHHRILPVLVIGPKEMITDDLLGRVRDRLTQWSDAWVEQTDGLSTASFVIDDDRRQLPPVSTAPALVPRGAY